MDKKTLYRYQRPDGGYSVSPKKPEGVKYTIKYRLIADDGKALTDGERITSCVDIEKNGLENWSEIDAPEINESEEI